MHRWPSANARQYRGSAFITLPDQKTHDQFWTYVEEAKTPKATLPSVTGHKKAVWVKPGMRVRVRYLRGEPMLRHASEREISH